MEGWCCRPGLNGAKIRVVGMFYCPDDAFREHGRRKNLGVLLWPKGPAPKPKGLKSLAQPRVLTLGPSNEPIRPEGRCYEIAHALPGNFRISENWASFCPEEGAIGLSPEFQPREPAQVAPRLEGGSRGIGLRTSEKSVTGVRFSAHIDKQTSSRFEERNWGNKARPVAPLQGAPGGGCSWG
jgi:hypothetical protein